MILKTLALGMFGANCYIVGSESTKEAIIIDPGEEPDVILSTIEEEGLTVPLIVATHAHFDHIGALGEVKEATGADFALHPDDTDLLKARMSRSGSWFGGSAQPPLTPDRLLREGDSIDLGEVHLSVLHTPGHSPGGICLLGHGMVFCGDTLFNLGIGRSDTMGGNFYELMDSIHSKLMTLPDETVVFPGHGPRTTIGNERRWNPFLRL